MHLMSTFLLRWAFLFTTKSQRTLAFYVATVTMRQKDFLFVVGWCCMSVCTLIFQFIRCWDNYIRFSIALNFIWITAYIVMHIKIFVLFGSCFLRFCQKNYKIVVVGRRWRRRRHNLMVLLCYRASVKSLDSNLAIVIFRIVVCVFGFSCHKDTWALLIDINALRQKKKTKMKRVVERKKKPFEITWNCDRN